MYVERVLQKSTMKFSTIVVFCALLSLTKACYSKLGRGRSGSIALPRIPTSINLSPTKSNLISSSNIKLTSFVPKNSGLSKSTPNLKNPTSEFLGKASSKSSVNLADFKTKLHSGRYGNLKPINSGLSRSNSKTSISGRSSLSRTHSMDSLSSGYGSLEKTGWFSRLRNYPGPTQSGLYNRYLATGNRFPITTAIVSTIGSQGINVGITLLSLKLFANQADALVSNLTRLKNDIIPNLEQIKQTEVDLQAQAQEIKVLHRYSLDLREGLKFVGKQVGVEFDDSYDDYVVPKDSKDWNNDDANAIAISSLASSLNKIDNQLQKLGGMRGVDFKDELFDIDKIAIDKRDDLGSELFHEGGKLKQLQENHLNR